jgi:hypothetical protein
MNVIVKNTFIDVEDESGKVSQRRRRSEPAAMHLAPLVRVEGKYDDCSMSTTAGESDCSSPTSKADDKSPSQRSEDDTQSNLENSRGTITTLMIRNIPPKYTQEMLLKEWPSTWAYDLLYLPCSAKTKRNSGYAFVNFTTEAAARFFLEMWAGMRLAHFSRNKPLSIIPARVQGRNTILELFSQNDVHIKKPLDFQPAII